MYDERRTVPLSKIDRFASQVTIKYYIEEEMSKYFYYSYILILASNRIMNKWTTRDVVVVELPSARG